MGGWKKICCAVDFSEPSRLAMTEASDLARRFGAELALVHVEAPLPQAATDVLTTPAEVLAKAVRDGEKLLAEWRAEAQARSGGAVRARVLTGNPAAEIVRFASDDGADLVVVATHGRTGLGHLFLGSVAERVVRAATCPVLVVRPKRPSEAEADAAEAAQYQAP